MMTGSALPVRRVTVNAVAAMNFRFFREASGLTQAEVGELIGWGKTVVSTAERSWEATRTRNFTADDLIAIARALRVPVGALLLPPEDDGVAFRYVLDIPGSEDIPLRSLLPLIFGGPDDESPAAEAYRKRVIALGWRPQSVEDARREADETLDRARREADRELQMARETAETIVGDTRKRVDRLELDAQEWHRSAISSLILQREDLERRVDDLRAFEREYRSRLRQVLESAYRDFMGEVKGIDAEELLGAMRRQASERGAGTVTALLLGDDGAYKVYTLDQVADIAEEQDGQAPEADEPGTAGEDNP